MPFPWWVIPAGISALNLFGGSGGGGGGGAGSQPPFDFDKWWEWFQQQESVPGVGFPGISTGVSPEYKTAMAAAGGGGSPWLGYRATVPHYEKELMSYLIGEPILSLGRDPFTQFGRGGAGAGPLMSKGAAAGPGWPGGRTAGATHTGGFPTFGKPSPAGTAVTGKQIGTTGGAWSGLQPMVHSAGPTSYGHIKGFGFPKNVSPWTMLTQDQRQFLINKWGAGKAHWTMPGEGGRPGYPRSTTPELLRPSPELKKRIGEYEMGIMSEQEKRSRLQDIEAAVAQKTLGLPEPERRKAITQAMADGVMKLDLEGAARENNNKEFILKATNARISQLQGAVASAQGWQGQALQDANQAKNRVAQMQTAALSATTQKEIAALQGKMQTEKTNMLKAMAEKEMAIEWIQFLLQLQYGYWNTQQQLEAGEAPDWLTALMGAGEVANIFSTILENWPTGGGSSPVPPV